MPEQQWPSCSPKDCEDMVQRAQQKHPTVKFMIQKLAEVFRALKITSSCLTMVLQLCIAVSRLAAQ